MTLFVYESIIDLRLSQATGLCLWGFGCPDRATVTTSPTAPGTARETEGQEASQHNRARRLRRPPLVMVTHINTQTLNLGYCVFNFFKSSVFSGLIPTFNCRREQRKYTMAQCRTCMHPRTSTSRWRDAGCETKSILWSLHTHTEHSRLKLTSTVISHHITGTNQHGACVCFSRFV